MGVSPAIFESANQRTEHLVPGVYSRSNNVTSPSGVSAGNLCIIGKSNGGEPQKLLTFGSLADAKATLLGGDLLNAVAYAFNGSNTYVPQRVMAMRVNPGTQSNTVLKSSGTNILKVNSWDWGSHCNQLKIKIEDGTVSDTKKVTIGYKDEMTTIDNVGRQSISLGYLGEGTNPICTITTTGIKLSATITVEETTEEGDVVEINWEDCETLQELVNQIEDSGLYAATLLDVSLGAKTNELDTCSNVSIGNLALDDGPEDMTVFNSNLQAFIDSILNVTFIGSVELLDVNIRVVPDNTDSFVYFTGGTIGSYTYSDFVAALEKLETEDIQIISTSSTDESIQAAIVSHCTSMSSTINRKERMCILGGVVGEEDDDAIAKARSFNNKLCSYVTDSAKAINPLTGKVENVSGAIVGVMLAGMESAMAVNEPLTFKTLNVIEFNKKRTLSNMEKLIAAGIMVCNNNPENAAEYVCIRALTTYQGNDLIANERSMTREAIYMDKDLRSRYVGGIGHTNNYSTASIEAVLKNAAKEWADLGYIIPDAGKNVWGIKIRISGDKVYLTYSRYLTAPRNFVFITSTNNIYENTVEL